MKIKINQQDCIGCGSCVAVCGDVFEIKETDEGPKAVIKGSGQSEGEIDNECAKEAVGICPVQVIEIEE